MGIENTLTQKLKENREATIKAALRAVDQFGEVVLGRAQYYCPVKEGWLKASGNTKPATIDGTTVNKKVGFNESYAAAVHEVLTAHHAPPTQAKYLERAMQEMAPQFMPFVEKTINAEVK